MRVLEDASLKSLAIALAQLDAGFSELPALPPPTPADTARIAAVLSTVAARLTDNYPYFHPLYAGQMLKPPHPIARAAYALAMWLNPNNHALDGGRASSHMEIEAVAALAKMFGLPQHLGHLTSGGTFANLEALWIAGKLNPGKKIVASAQAHYTHSRICSVLGLDFATIAAAPNGAMDLTALRTALAEEEVGTVVATLGATATGAVDPLDEILALREQYGFRLHVDAAYGGYFTLAETLDPAVRRAFDAIAQADSVVVDPHKHGLQPYGCGCILFRDPAVGRFYKHDSPYTYFSSAELHLGEISLECSRPGASATALWATQQLLPMERGGEFAHGLDSSLAAARDLYSRLAADTRFIVPAVPQLDIVVWAVRAADAAASSAAAHRVFTAAAEKGLHLALADLPIEFFPAGTWPAASQSTVTCLRSVLMKPEHLDWLDHIWFLLQGSIHA
ncbi:MAG: aminotransferase class I/II-fold pyridoxal phosphate-dependent enzyme [Acidobacteriaceae bacterium]|nr:aminotransferase class I/II-fold pyridoxal phosphate-dependent enzyme [Acidobacteriaceae bacterium]